MISKKLPFLIEYYRYHNEIPRFFAKELEARIFRYHNK